MLEKIKNRTIIIAIASIIFILYMIDSQIHFISDRVYNLSNLQQPSTIILRKKKNQEHVFSFEIHIVGHIDGEARVKLYQDYNKGSLYKEKFLSGDVDVVWGGDWYADLIRIEYIPISVSKKSKLKIKYSFNGILD